MRDQSTVLIPLYARDGSIQGHTAVDLTDADWVSQWRWHRSSEGYAVRSTRTDGTKAFFSLHRVLLGFVTGDGREVDHINRDKLDNRRANLREATRPQNAQNVPSMPGSSSKYRGVSWDASKRRWGAWIRVNGRTINLGRFTSEQAAADRAHEARLRLFPYAID